MIKAVFFDWGHTFATFSKGREKKLNKLLRPFGLNWQKFHPCWRQFYILRSAGRIKNDSEFEEYIRGATQKEIPVKKIIEITIESHFISKTHIETVRKLKKKYRIGILSNNVQEWVEQVMRNYKIVDLFDAVVISSKIGARKPNAVIYFEALKTLRVEPEESIFVADEVAEDLVAATGLGMKTIWLNSSKGWWSKDDAKVLKIYKPDAVVKNLREVISVIKSI